MSFLITAIGIGVSLPLLLILALRENKRASRARIVVLAVMFSVLSVTPLWLYEWLGDLEPNITTACVGAAITLVLSRLALTPIRMQLGLTDELAALEDATIHERVTALSARMRLQTPRVYLLGSASGSLTTLAWAGCLVSPSLVLTDGLLYRLRPDERDAIIAHELGHLANFSLYRLPFTFCAVSLFAVWLSTLCAPLVALCALFALFLATDTILSRRSEISADRYAARAVGHGATARALDKIHAALPRLRRGFNTFWIHTTASHPSVDTRLAALWRDAPALERERIQFDRRFAYSQIIASWTLFSIWVSALTVILVDATNTPVRTWHVVGILTVMLAPLSWRILLHYDSAKLGESTSMFDWRSFFQVVFLLAALVGAGFALSGYIWALWLEFGGGTLLVVMRFVSSRRRLVEQRVGMAMRRHEFERALEFAQQDPLDQTKWPALAHNIALCHAMLGHKDEARERAAAILERWPKFSTAYGLAASLALEDDPHQALDLAEDAFRKFPKFLTAKSIAARACLRLGELDAALRWIERGRTQNPEDGQLTALLAEVSAWERKLANPDGAWARLETAESQAPGDAFVALVRARVAAIDGDRQRFSRELSTATTSVEAAPFAMLHSELDELRNQPLPWTQYPQETVPICGALGS